MLLTPEAVLSAPAYLNPIGSRELSLRGRQISQIENLGVTKDLNDTLNLTDNDIQNLANFPRLRRLQTLLVGRNRITAIADNLAESLPNLQHLVLSNNGLAQLADLTALKGLTKLTHLVLQGNAVTALEHYRQFVVWLCPSIKVLDFERIKPKHLHEAAQLFGTPQEPSELARAILSAAKTAPSVVAQKRSMAFSAQEKEILRQRLKSAKTLAEIEQLELELRS